MTTDMFPELRLSRDALEALTAASVQTPPSGRTGFQLGFDTDRPRVVDELQIAQLVSERAV